MIRKFLWVVHIQVLFLLALPMDAQDLDSLRRAWENRSLSDSLRLVALHDLAWEGFLFSDPDSAQVLADLMLAKAQEKGERVHEARAIDLQAAVRYVQGNMQEALALYERSVVIYDSLGLEAEMANTLTNMASMYSFLGEHEKALSLYERGYAVHVAVADYKSMANDLNAIGRVHAVRGDHARAADLYRQSQHIQERIGNKRGLYTSLGNLGSLYILQADYDEGLRSYQAAFDLAEELDDQHYMGKALAEIGTCQLAMGDTGTANASFQRSLKIRRAIGDEHGIVHALTKVAEVEYHTGGVAAALQHYQEAAELAAVIEYPFGLATAMVGKGHILLDQGKLPQALTIAEQAFDVASDADDVSLDRDAARLLYSIHKAAGRYGAALAMHERFVLLNDSLLREENQREVLRYGFAYAYEKQALADSLAHQEETFALTTAHRDRRNMMVAAMLILLVIGLALWGRLRYMARANKRIMAAQADLVQSERQREAEQVRNRIASDIHDDLGSDLTKLVLLGDEMKRTVAEQAQETARIADRIVELSREATTALSDVVWAADPHQDTTHGLITRCSAYAHRMLDGTELASELQFQHTGPDKTLDPGFKHDAYLLLKELLNNVVKHSGAKRVSVSLNTDPDRFRLIVRDDGRGFDPSTVERGNGSRSIRIRATRIGASVDIDTGPGKGCVVRIEGPLNSIVLPIDGMSGRPTSATS